MLEVNKDANFRIFLPEKLVYLNNEENNECYVKIKINNKKFILFYFKKKNKKILNPGKILEECELIYNGDNPNNYISAIIVKNLCDKFSNHACNAR